MTTYHAFPNTYEAHYIFFVRKYGNSRLGRFLARRDAAKVAR